jgi:hypothetical protein
MAIQTIIGLDVYMSDFEVRSLTWNSCTCNITDLSGFICAKDVGWMAELVLEGRIGSLEELLQDSVVTYAAEHCDKLFRLLMV